MTKRITLLFVFILLVSTASNANADLEKCWQKQVQPIIDQYLTFDMQETENYFSHSMNPWDQGTYKIKGNLGVRPNSFFKRDTLTTERGKEYHSIVQYENNQLLFLDYGDTEWYAVTESMVVDQLVKTCRYSPVLILDYFYNYQVSESIESTVSTQVYQTTIGSYFISLFIDRGKEEVIKITATADLEKDDEYYGFGDVEEVFLYTDYASIKTFSFPKNIQILKLNNKLSDQVLLSNPVITSESPRLFEEPENYLIQKDFHYFGKK